MALSPNNFPYDITELRVGGSQFSFLRRWYERTRNRMRADQVFWPGFFLTFDIHLHLSIYAVSNLPWWPAALVREQPTAQLAVRCPWFCIVLAYRAYDWCQFLSWRTEIAFYYHHVSGWRFEDGGVLFDRERKWKISELFLSERAIREGSGYRNEIKFERVY